MTNPKNLLRMLVAIWSYLAVLSIAALFAGPMSMPDELKDYLREHAIEPDVLTIAWLLVYWVGIAGLWFTRRWGRALATVAFLALPFVKLACGPLVAPAPMLFLENFRLPLIGAMLTVMWLSPGVAQLFQKTPRGARTPVGQP